MKVCLIGPGYKPIPPIGWGAVESVVWDYYVNLKHNNISVNIINNKNLQEVINDINSSNYDIVHIMYDDHIIIVPFIQIECKILYTSHFAYITHPNFQHRFNHYFVNIFSQVIANKDKIFICAISEQIKQTYIKYGFPDNKIYITHNGARNDAFDFNESPQKYNRSIYLAKIEERKKQYIYQSIEDIDFVGNYHNSSFDCNKPNYLGEWNKDTLYKSLSSYGNLVLLSDGEADPLVVKEALICGLGVVVSECSAANIDECKDFIDIIPNNKLNDLTYVENIIRKNRIISVENRNTIREYGLSKFSWDNLIVRYTQILNEL
jgi:hypothetical protein